MKRTWMIIVGMAITTIHFAGGQPKPDEAASPVTVTQRIKFSMLSLEDGLSQSTITCLLQDHDGYMWFGTQEGLNRYDGYRFTIYKHNPQDPASLGDQWIETLFEDRAGRLWIGTRNGGLHRFLPADGSFLTFRHDAADSTSLGDNQVLSIAEDAAHRLWVGTSNGVLNRMDMDSGRFRRYRAATEDTLRFGRKPVFALHLAQNDTLFAGTLGNGLLRYDSATDRLVGLDALDAYARQNIDAFWILSIGEDHRGNLLVGTNYGLFTLRADLTVDRHLSTLGPPAARLGSNRVRGVASDETGALWIATLGGGLSRFTASEGISQIFTARPGTHTLISDDILSIGSDRSGEIWLGTRGGIQHFNPNPPNFEHYDHEASNPASLSDNSVWAFEEGRDGRIWIGTLNGGLNSFDPQSNTFRHFQHQPGDPRSLSHNSVWALELDHAGQLWAGTRGGGLSRLNTRTGNFRRFQQVPGDTTSLSHNWVMSVLEDSRQQLWVGTWGGGLDLLDTKQGTFRHFRHRPGVAGSLSHNGVWLIFEDRRGDLWVGTENGLNRLDRDSGKFTVFLPEPGNPNSLSNRWVTAICEDSDGYLWMGTEGGLNRFDPQQGHFRQYRKADGLPNDVIYGILEDEDHMLWISTNQGLSRFNPRSGAFKNYDISDGLQSNEFNGGAALKAASGEMYFGGINGFNVFRPQAITDNDFVPPVVLTAMRYYNKDHPEGVTEPQPYRYRDQPLKLTYRDNILIIEFAALNFRNSERNQYAYRLQGFQDQWIQLGNKRDVTFTNLDPGEYIFHVKASNDDGVWNDEGTSLPISISPPWWRTTWAYIAYGLLFFMMLFYLRRFELNRQKRRLELRESQLRARDAEERAREKAEMLQIVEEKNQELDETNHELIRTREQVIMQEKLASLGALTAGIAHEIKNPLNFVNNFAALSVEIVEDLQAELPPLKPAAAVGELLGELAENARRIQEHGIRANEILKSMLQHSRRRRIEFAPIDVHDVLRENVAMALEEIRQEVPAFEVDTQLELTAEPASVEGLKEDLSRALLNIIRNGMESLLEKHRRAEGFPAMLHIATDRVVERLQIRVRDNGGGIDPQVAANIFNPFFTTKPSGRGNAGLGLSIGYDIIVKIHNGAISFESRPDEFTEFVIELPLQAIAAP